MWFGILDLFLVVCDLVTLVLSDFGGLGLPNLDRLECLGCCRPVCCGLLFCGGLFT